MWSAFTCLSAILTDEQFEPVRKKPRLDIDKDSVMGLDIFTSERSTALFEVTCLKCLLYITVYICKLSLYTLGPSGQGDRGIGL